MRGPNLQGSKRQIINAINVLMHLVMQCREGARIPAGLENWEMSEREFQIE
jgi:hypothetical protein